MLATATQNIFNFTGDADATKGIIVPKGGGILVADVVVDPACAWESMIKAACPDYLDPDLLKVESEFPPHPGEPRKHRLIGVNFGESISDTWPAVDWARKNALVEASPRHVYKVVHDIPDLNKRVDMSWMVLVSPQNCAFEGGRRVCDAGFDDAKR